MSSQSMVIDNIAELLIKIIEFTEIRQKVLTQNINNFHNPDFVPNDLSVDEFSELMNIAINEHSLNGRLLLRDSKNVKFGAAGSFKVEEVIDTDAEKLLAANRDEYLEEQINKLLENSLNQRIAVELLRQKQGILSIFE